MRANRREQEAMDGPVIRRHNGWEIRNKDGLYWDSHSKMWAPVGMRWSGFGRREMRKMAREVGGTLVHMVLVRRSRTGRTAVRCPDCAARLRAFRGEMKETWSR